MVYNVNVTSNLIEDEIYEIIDDKRIPLISRVGLSVPCNADEFFKRFSQMFVNKSDRPLFESTMNVRHLQESYESGQKEIVFEYESIFVRENPIMLRHTILLTKDSASKDVIALCNAKDIRYQTRLVNALQSAKDADRAKTVFLASMSHEIRTPLNAIIGFSELLTDANIKPEKRNEYLHSISSAGQALLDLINDILDLSKLEVGQMQFSPSMTDIGLLLDDVGKIFAPKMTEKGISFVSESPADMPLVCVDKLRVRQILFNIIGNAVKFTDQGGIRAKLAFAAQDSKTGTLSFSISDSGIGISEKDQKQLFSMFVQADSIRGSHTANKGTGLGLALCKRLVENMNGKIDLQSELGRGTTISVEIPNIEYELKKESSAQLKNTRSHIDFSAAGYRVLIVDDIAINLKILRAMLEKLGLKVNEISSANAAILNAAKNDYDYILTDLWMPERNGSSLASEVRKNGKPIRIAAITADTECSETFNTDVFDAIITKPISMEKLQAFFANNPPKR